MRKVSEDCCRMILRIIVRGRIVKPRISYCATVKEARANQRGQCRPSQRLVVRTPATGCCTDPSQGQSKLVLVAGREKLLHGCTRKGKHLTQNEGVVGVGASALAGSWQGQLNTFWAESDLEFQHRVTVWLTKNLLKEWPTEIYLPGPSELLVSL